MFKKITPTAVFLAGSLIWLAAAFHIVLSLKRLDFIADQKHVYDCVQQIFAGNYSAFDSGTAVWADVKGYFFTYPNNLGLAVIELFLLSVWNSRYMLYIFWFLCAVLNQFLLWQITKCASDGDRATENLCLILGFAFLPNLMLFLVIYGDLPGMTFLLAALVLLFLYKQTGKNGYAMSAVLCLALAVVIRNNLMIAAIALSVCFILDAIKSGKWRPLVFAVAMLVLPVISYKVLLLCFELISGRKILGMPPIMWTAMGLQEGNRYSGWFNNWAFETFVKSGSDNTLAKNAACEYISGRLHEFITSHGTATVFFGRKFVSTFNEPTFLSLVYSYGKNTEFTTAHTGSRFLISLFAHGSAAKAYELWNSAISVLISFFAGFRFFISRKKEMNPLYYFPLLFLIGNTLFYIFLWETKSRFVWPCYYFLIPSSAIGIRVCSNSVRNRFCKKNR